MVGLARLILHIALAVAILQALVVAPAAYLQITAAMAAGVARVGALALDPAAVVVLAGIRVMEDEVAAILVAVTKAKPAAEALVAARLLHQKLLVAAPAAAA
jgi:hypothetical protein